MIGTGSLSRRFLSTLALGGLLACGLAHEAQAGGWLRGRGRVVVPTTATVQPSPSGSLGSFYPTPYMTVRGNFPAGGGYSPLGEYGDTTMSLYGPLSSLRATSAPVTLYSRGYDGRTYATEATGFSTPNLPALSPVVYPTQATYYYGFPNSSTPPWWKSGINWIDQN